MKKIIKYSLLLMVLLILVLFFAFRFFYVPEVEFTSSSYPNFEIARLEMHTTKISNDTVLAFKILSEVYSFYGPISYGTDLPRELEKSYEGDYLVINVLDEFVNSSNEGYLFIDMDWLKNSSSRKVKVVLQEKINEFNITYEDYVAEIITDDADLENIVISSYYKRVFLPESDLGNVTG